MASADVRDELLCSICLNIFTDPVTLKCGHNFCRVCIDQHLNTQDGSGVYSCPECRAEFHKRPALKRNINLRNVAERVLSTQPHQEEVTRICCTYCIHSPVPAVKSCLLCEASLCDNHLKVHSKEAEHVLTDPSTSLEKRKCSFHKELLKYYCTKDAICICVSCCLIGEHQGHEMESLDEASEKKKKKLRNDLQKLITKRKKTEERIQSLEEHWREAQEKASGEVERVTALFIDIRRRLDDLEKRILRDICKQEEQMSLSQSHVIQKLEIMKDELSRKMRHIEKLCNMTDPLTVLQDPDTGDLCDPEEEGGDEETGGHDGDEDTGGHDGGDEDTGGHDKTHDVEVDVITRMLHAGFADIMTYLSNISPAKPKVMAAGYGGIYGEGPADMLLDVNTAGEYILISDDLKTATKTDKRQNRPVTAERFQDYQVMSSKRFTSGRHYWDVELRRSEWWRVGMCYPSIYRKAVFAEIGADKKSWCLYRGWLYNNRYSVRHDSKTIRLPHQIASDRVRIYVDYEAGQLSFYELCDPIRHIHTFTATFSEPLHAVLCVSEGSIKILGGAPGGNGRM